MGEHGKCPGMMVQEHHWAVWQMQGVQSRDFSPCGATGKFWRRRCMKISMPVDSRLQGPPSEILGDGPCGGIGWSVPVRRQEPWILHRSAESNYLCQYSLHSKDNWGLTSCWLSSWAMLNICYHDGKQTSLQGFEGQMTECIWKGFEHCKLLPRCKGDIKFDSFLVAVTSSSDFFVSHFVFF